MRFECLRPPRGAWGPRAGLTDAHALFLWFSVSGTDEPPAAEVLGPGHPFLPRLLGGDAHACWLKRSAVSATAQPASATSPDTDL